jgi:hypothetical protein
MSSRSIDQAGLRDTSHFPLLSVDGFVSNVIFEIHIAIKSQGVHLPAIAIVEGSRQ